MATIIVEDGSIVTGANSYLSEAALATYAADRGITIVGTANILIIQAMDYIESLGFIGIKHTDAQPLQWPRSSVFIDRNLQPVDEIPQLLIDSVSEVVLAIDAGNSPVSDVERQTKNETVGAISVEYMDGSSATTIVRTINTKLRKLLISPAGGSSFTVVRA